MLKDQNMKEVKSHMGSNKNQELFMKNKKQIDIRNLHKINNS
jgi:hypothetical protein